MLVTFCFNLKRKNISFYTVYRISSIALYAYNLHYMYFISTFSWEFSAHIPVVNSCLVLTLYYRWTCCYIRARQPRVWITNTPKILTCRSLTCSQGPGPSSRRTMRSSVPRTSRKSTWVTPTAACPHVKSSWRNVTSTAARTTSWCSPWCKYGASLKLRGGR